MASAGQLKIDVPDAAAPLPSALHVDIPDNAETGKQVKKKKSVSISADTVFTNKNDIKVPSVLTPVKQAKSSGWGRGFLKKSAADKARLLGRPPPGRLNFGDEATAAETIPIIPKPSAATIIPDLLTEEDIEGLQLTEEENETTDPSRCDVLETMSATIGNQQTLPPATTSYGGNGTIPPVPVEEKLVEEAEKSAKPVPAAFTGRVLERF